MTRRDDILVVRMDNPPVNALSAVLRRDIAEALRRALQDPAVRAVVLTGGGKSFIAGADISEFGKPPVAPILPDVLAAIDAAAKPVVAAINGVALGGGLEVALACHARIAAAGAKLGLPEIKLGIIPGAGGTQRLPRLIGAAKAFPMMLSGNPVSAHSARALGLVDAVAGPDLLDEAVTLARRLADTGERPTISAGQGKLDADDRAAFEVLAKAAEAKSGDMPNVGALVSAVRAAFDLPFAEGLAVERAAFRALVADERSKALRYAFFAERGAARLPGTAQAAKPRPVQRVAVIGAGTMGTGIAMCAANAGLPVTLIETDGAGVARGMERLRSTYDISVKRGSLSAADRDARIALITPAVGLEAAADADLVIEAAFEEMGIKREIFGRLDSISKPGAVLATNTSYLDVAAIAAATSRPGDVLGMHFFSPANVMKLLEIVRPDGVSDDALSTAAHVGRAFGKVPVVVGNCFGFVGNRMLSRRTKAAEWLLLAGALPHEVDAALTGFGFRMGPFAMADLAGNDIGWRTRKSLGTTAIVADTICEMGRLGQKTGKGYYLYPEGARSGVRDAEIEALIERLSADQGFVRRSFTAEEILAHLLDPMVNEGARILEEGIAARPGDIDTIWINGYNWPAWRGGPMYWADTVGLPEIVARLDRAAVVTGDTANRPADLLRRLAHDGRGFAGFEATAN